MAEYTIPIIWESYKTYTVEADNLQQAVNIALTTFFKEPDDNYLEDSFSLDDDMLAEQYPMQDYSLFKYFEN